MYAQRRVYLGLAALCCLFLNGSVHGEEQSIQFGIFPYVSPGQLVKFHNPLRAYMEETLGEKVSLVTAPSFKDFVSRTREGQYDIIMTAPHLGKLAELQGYKRISHDMHEVQGVYLVHKDSEIKSLPDLKGKVITLVGRAAIITQMVEYQLKSLGLEADKDVTFRITRTHNNAMYAPLRGESDASVTGILLFNKIGEEDRKHVRVIGKTPMAPGFMVMAGKRITEAQRQKLTQALLNFINTPAGKDYLKTTGLKRFEPITDQEMQDMEPYIQIFLKNKT
jgi:phosphonate transport system substrate-binding protein